MRFVVDPDIREHNPVMTVAGDKPSMVSEDLIASWAAIATTVIDDMRHRAAGGIASASFR